MKQISVRARDAAKMLGVSLPTLDRLTRAGEFRCWKVHGQHGPRFFAVADLEEFVKRRIANGNEAAVPAKPEHLLSELEGQDCH